MSAWLPILSVAHPILGKELFLVMILGTRILHIIGLRNSSRILRCEQSGIQHGPTTTLTFLVVTFVKGLSIVLPDHARHPVRRGVTIALSANWAFSFFTPDYTMGLSLYTLVLDRLSIYNLTVSVLIVVVRIIRASSLLTIVYLFHPVVFAYHDFV